METKELQHKLTELETMMIEIKKNQLQLLQLMIQINRNK